MSNWYVTRARVYYQTPMNVAPMPSLGPFLSDECYHIGLTHPPEGTDGGGQISHAEISKNSVKEEGGRGRGEGRSV